MKKRMLIVLILFTVVLTNCNKKDGTYEEIEFTTIGQDNLYGNGQENIDKDNLTIYDTESWNSLLTKIDTKNNVSDGFLETSIDFTNFMVIAIFDEVYGNGGHSIDIVKIEENASNIVVTIDNILKGDITTVMTQPFHLVKIKKTDKQITFE